jgi:glutathione S-transferase
MNPGKHLLADDREEEARVIESISYIEGTLHGQGFARIFVPASFAPQGVAHSTTGLELAAVKEQGRKLVETGFAILDSQLGRHPYAAGEEFGIADAALFYVERWAPQQDILLPANVKSHFERTLARPAVRKVVNFWGE